MNRLPILFAWRYLVSKKKHNVINLITSISMVGVGIGAMALVVVLSVFNGLEDLVGSLYSSFDPQIKVQPATGKTFVLDENQVIQLQNLEQTAVVSTSIEETVHLKYKGREALVTMKGVGPEFSTTSGVDTMMVEGSFTLEQDSIPYAVMGYGVSYDLMVYVEENHVPITVHAAKRKGRYDPLQPQASFVRRPIMPSGIFSINQDFDDKYFIVPLGFAQEILQYPGEISAYEIMLKDEVSMKDGKAAIASVLGPDFVVKTRFEQNELVYKTSQSEKWITFMILAFIILLATLNMLGSLVMIILEKKADIFILKSLGMAKATVKNAFRLLAVVMSMVGTGLGLLLGLMLILAQQHFGLIELSGAVVEYFPVEIQLFDIGAILALVLVVSWVAAWLPAKMAGNYYNNAVLSGN